MIDVHCHYLPGIDDGAQTLAESLDLARAAVAAGIKTAVLTPHVHEGRYNNNLSSIKNAFSAFERALDDSAIEIIGTCHQLKELRVTGVTDDNLRHLSRLDRLKGLGLMNNSRLTDEGARRLVDQFPGLVTLMIHDASLSDTALAEFARLSKLQSVQIRDTPITDDGILEFKSCPTLRALYLKNTLVTPAGAAELRKSLPTVEVKIE